MKNSDSKQNRIQNLLQISVWVREKRVGVRGEREKDEGSERRERTVQFFFFSIKIIKKVHAFTVTNGRSDWGTF